MDFTIHQKNLSYGIGIVEKAVSTKSTLNLLEGIYIEAIGDKLYMYATDGDMGISTEVSAKVNTEGSFVLSARLFVELVRKFPNKDIRIKLDENGRALVQCEKSKLTLQSINGKEFPLPKEEAEIATLHINKVTLKEMIKKTIFATSKSESMPILMGCLLEIRGEKMYMVAVDGYKLSLKSERNIDNTNVKVVIPEKGLKEVLRIIDDNGDLEIIVNNNGVCFKDNFTTIYSKTLQGEFLNFEQIIPKNNPIKIKCNIHELSDAIDRASLVAKESLDKHVKMDIALDTIKITSRAEIASVLEEVRIEKEGDDIEIAFNSKYLLEGLKSFTGEEIVMEFDKNISPCIIRDPEDDSQLFMVLPVRF